RATSGPAVARTPGRVSSTGARVPEIGPASSTNRRATSASPILPHRGGVPGRATPGRRGSVHRTASLARWHSPLQRLAHPDGAGRSSRASEGRSREIRRPGAVNGSADRAALQHLKVRLLLDRYRPDALPGKLLRMAIAPKDFLRPLLELAGLRPWDGA